MSLRHPFAAWNRNFALLAAAVFSVGAFFGVQLSLHANFVVKRLDIGAFDLGYVEALREIPGFLNVLFIAAMIRLAPSRVAGLALGTMGLGVMAYAGVSSVGELAVYSVVWSVGFHCWVPLEQAMALELSPSADKGRWLGQQRSVSSLAWLLAIGSCMLVMPLVGYNGLYVAAGVTTILGGVAISFASRRRVRTRERGFVLDRRYSVYYALNFLQGCRKQMFITFAIFALVKVHGMPVETTLILVFINQVLITVSSPKIGRLVDRYGERRMLTASYLGLILVFFGYAVVDHRPSLYVLYCIDNLIFFGGIALTTYAHKIALPEDLKPTLSMGVTMNHVAAVAAPLIGGLVWHYFGYRVIFLSGSALALVSLVVSQWVDPEAQSPAHEGLPIAAGS